MIGRRAARLLLSIKNHALQIAVVSAVFGIIPAASAISAERITDRNSCGAAVTTAEDAIVRANIDSNTFRLLNDQLVETRVLCDQDNYSAAESKLAGVMNALKHSAKK
jgi:hypothetical protein